MTNRTHCFLFAAALLLCSLFAHSQVPVAMAPPIHFQFLNASGQPLANGQIFTYQGGTTTLQNTYVDSTGTTQNPDPILLDATGSPSNGSTETGIFLSNLSWKFVAYDVNGVFQWSVDNVTTYFALLNSVSTWTAAQTFTQPLTDTATDNQFILGSLGLQTTLDFPPPLTNVTLHFPATADTMVGRATTDTLTNKTLTSPTVNGVAVTGIPEQTLCSLAPVTVNANTTGQQVIQVCSLPSAVLNTPQKSIRITWEVSMAPGSNIVNQVSYGIAKTVSTSTGQVCNATTGSATTCLLSFTCTTLVTGSSGSLGCGGSTSGTLTASFTPWTTITVDLTGVIQVASLCAFGSASASNSCTGNQLIVEQLN